MLLTRFVPFAALSTHKPRQSAARTSIAGQAYVSLTAIAACFSSAKEKLHLSKEQDILYES
jgi:hypothetical protein